MFEDIEISTLELEHSAACIGYSFYFNRKPRFEIEMAKSNNVPKKLWNVLQNGQEVIEEGTLYKPSMVLGRERKGIKVSLITDTRPIDTIPDFIRDSDLFICEGTYGDNNDIDKAIKNKHMTFREAANLAQNGNVLELLLTHFSPAILEPEEFKQNAIDIFKKTIIGEDRMIKSLSFNS